MVGTLKRQAMKCKGVGKPIFFLLSSGAPPDTFQVQMWVSQRRRLSSIQLALRLQVQTIVIAPTTPYEFAGKISKPKVHRLDHLWKRGCCIHHRLSDARKLGAEVAQQRITSGSDKKRAGIHYFASSARQYASKLDDLHIVNTLGRTIRGVPVAPAGRLKVNNQQSLVVHSLVI